MLGSIRLRMAPTSILHSILILSFIVFITGCGTSRKDGPPSYYVDVSRIKNAVPKPEPLAKYGNKPVYSVFGKRYYVMRSSKHYEAVGTASWYGTKFHNRKTSSGEAYDMLAMTAAHKSLPLPTYVEVTNLRNGQKIIVKVNDRGPFVGNRLIDLSYVAARKLGMYGNGTAPVRIKAIDPYYYAGNDRYRKPAAPVVVAHTVTRGRIVPNAPYRPNKAIYVQVGAFKNKDNALRLKQRVYSLTQTPVEIATQYNSALYRVRIGPLNNTGTANRLISRLAAIGLKPTKVIDS